MEEDCFKFVDKINLPQLNEQEKLKCEGYVTIKECFESLNKMGNNKTPGNDGLSKEFYLVFWQELGQMMIESFNYSFETGTLSTSQNQVIFTLLEKPDKDTRCIENWKTN